MTRRRLGAAGLTVLLVAGLLIVVNSSGWKCLFPPSTFDAAMWQSADTDGTCNPRRGMVANLMANHLEVGMARADVRTLLGDPNTEDPSVPTSFYYVHCLIDCDYLAVQYDLNGLVADLYVGQD